MVFHFNFNNVVSGRKVTTGIRPPYFGSSVLVLNTSIDIHLDSPAFPL